MSELTKQQLRNELVSHGVKPPSPAAKKSEYVKIYEKYVAPVAQSKGDFSSDDEDLLPVNDVKVQKMSLDTSSMVINGLDISNLEDDELYARLQELGSPVGPIVDTTRTVYQKKLFVLLGGQVPDAPTFNGDVDQEEDEYSDNEPEVAAVAAPERQRRVVNQTTHTVRTYTTKAASAITPSTSHFSETRHRVVPPSGETSLHDSSILYDHDLHTPSPRRSLRTVTSSESSSYRRIVNNGKTSTRFATSDGHDAVDSSSSPGKLSSILRVLVKLLFLALIIAVALYYYQNHETESPFKSIEEMARQALEAASGEEVTLSPKDTDHTPQQQQEIND